VQKLLTVLQRLLDRGDTVIVVEHHLDVIAAADRVIELGPEAGDAGGRVVGQGTPEDIAAMTGSHTGRFLRTRVSPAEVAAPKKRRKVREEGDA
jgi:excinuclease ABC subunit A